MKDFKKHSELFNSYKEKISSLLKQRLEDVIIERDGTPVNYILYYEKNEEEAREFCKGLGIDFNMENFIMRQGFGLGKFKVKLGEVEVASFRLYELQHCCAFMVSCTAKVEEDYQGRGLGSLMNQFRQDIGRCLGYTSILCTDLKSNEAQRHILKKNGWKDIHEITNKRTNNELYLSVIDL